MLCLGVSIVLLQQHGMERHAGLVGLYVIVIGLIRSQTLFIGQLNHLIRP